MSCILRNLSRIAKLTSILSCVLFFSLAGYARQHEAAYWIWAGILPNEAPPSSMLYIYQGSISGEDAKFRFQKKGVHPHPLSSPGIFLCYRVQGTVFDHERLLALFRYHTQLWERHKVPVLGLQIDHDVATAKVKNYSLVLEKIRSQLDRRFQLSITGLSDWALRADSNALDALHKSVDEVVYQSYQIRDYVANAEAAIHALDKQKRTYKLGLLARRPLPFVLNKSSNRLGIVYFLQKEVL